MDNGIKKFFIYLFKGKKQLNRIIATFFWSNYAKYKFFVNDVSFKSVTCRGNFYINKSIKAKVYFGSRLTLNNGVKYSELGINGCCRFDVRDSGILIIGENVGLSDVTITCHEKIAIKNNVIIGVGTQIRDTDNHSLNPEDRLNSKDWENKKTAPILINQNVFLGTNVIVLKGVTIGENSIIAAGSVVTKSIPNNEIWGGNPARKIGELNNIF